jgi:rhamnosyltransferase
VINTYPISGTKISAVIVLYFPDEVLLERLVASIKGTVASIIVVDNTPSGKIKWLAYNWFVSKSFDVVYKALGDNYGIAKAQNEGIAIAIANNSDHVILFDQDSAASPMMVQGLLTEELALLAFGVKVGAVGPAFMDEKTGDYANVIRYGNFLTKRIPISFDDVKPIRAGSIIASGALIRVSVLKEVGLMREDLFIDGVDIEWALRASHFGYQHFVAPRALMLHSMGDSYMVVGKRKLNIHSDLRHFYMVRNSCNLAVDAMMGRQFRTIIFLKIPLYVVFYSLTSATPLTSLKHLLRACFDGFSGNLGKAIL